MSELQFWPTWSDLVLEAIYEVLDAPPVYVRWDRFVFWPKEIEYMLNDPSRFVTYLARCEEEAKHWGIDIGIRVEKPHVPEPTPKKSDPKRKMLREALRTAIETGRCIVHGCVHRATQHVELYALKTVVPVCDAHAPLMELYDSEIQLERNEDAIYGRPQTATLGRVVPEAEVFPEFDEDGNVSATQASMAVYSAAYLQQYEMPDEIIEVSVVDKSEWASDPLFKAALPYIAGEIDLEYVDPRFVDPDLYWLFEDETASGGYELPELDSVLESIANQKKEEDVA